MSNVTDEEIKKIMKVVNDLEDFKDFKTEFALLKEKIIYNDEKIKDEITERKSEINNLKKNYVDRFKSLDIETKKNRSKIGDTAKILQNKIEAVENQISGLYLSLSDFIKEKITGIKDDVLKNVDCKIKDETNIVSKIIIKFMWIIIGIVVTGFISFWVKEFVQYMGWATP